MKKIIFLPLFLALLFSCSKESRQKEEVTTIDFWTDQTQTDRYAQIRLVLDTFEMLNPQYRVNLVSIDVNDISRQMTAAVTAGTAPDLVHTSTQFILAFDEGGLLDNQANEQIINQIGTERFYKGAVDLSKSVSNSGFFMVPFHFMIQGVWYRQDWFEEAGLEPPSDYNSLLTAAQHFYRPSENRYGLVLGTKAQEQYNEQNFLQIATANNAYLFNRDGSLAIDSPEMREALAYYKELAQYIPPGPQTWRSRDYYLQGKLAMFFYSSYIMDDLALQEAAANSLTADNFDDLEGADFDRNLVINTQVAPTFTWKESSGYAEMNGLSILKGDDPVQIEAAQKLILSLFEHDTYISLLHIAPGGMFPVLSETTESDEFLNDPDGIYSRYGREKIVGLASGIDSARSFLIREGKLYPEAATVASKLIIPDLLYQITELDMPIDEAVSEAKRKIEELLEE